MKLTDIENLSASDLKGKRAELVEAATTAEHAELAARYVQARTDAAIRDEKLAEQGATITALQEALADRRAEAEALSADLRTVQQEQTAAEDRSRKAIESRDETIQRHEAKAAEDAATIKAEAQATTTAQDLAKRRRKVLADISNLIAPLLAEEG